MAAEPKALIALRCKACATPVSCVILGGGSIYFCFTCRHIVAETTQTLHCSQCLAELNYDIKKEQWECAGCNIPYPLLPPKPVYEDESFEWFKPPDNPRT